MEGLGADFGGPEACGRRVFGGCFEGVFGPPDDLREDPFWGSGGLIWGVFLRYVAYMGLWATQSEDGSIALIAFLFLYLLPYSLLSNISLFSL